MSRSRLIEEKKLGINNEKYKNNDHRNDASRTFKTEIDKVFGEKILPDEFGNFINPENEETKLYIPNREWLIEEPIPNDEWGHEVFLHKLFFPHIAPNNPLLILSGNEGVGKSTLIRYYFDCCLKSLNNFTALMEVTLPNKLWQNDLNKIIVFYLNLRHTVNVKSAENKIYNILARQIRNRFQNISTENNCSMWSRRVDWEDYRHKNYKDQKKHRIVYTDAFNKDNNIFVEEALWYLGTLKDNDLAQRYYITIIFDDIDTLHDDIQVYVFQLILQWLNDRIYHVSFSESVELDSFNIWKIILPIRPETLKRITPIIQPIEKKDVFPIGNVDQLQLISKRSQKIREIIRKSNKNVETDIVIGENEFLVYKPLNPHTAADQVGEMLSIQYESGMESESNGIELEVNTKIFLENFCNGSNRRLLRLRRRAASSIPVEIAVRNIRTEKKKNSWISRHAFMNGIILDGRNHFQKYDPDNDILNIFDITTQLPSAYTMLVGPQLLFFLYSRSLTIDALFEKMISIGYSENELQECLISFGKADLIKFIRQINSKVESVQVQQKVINAYMFLLADKAYIDNMALVTPVENIYLNDMNLTTSFRPEDFKKRVLTTFEFLKQLRSDEDEICNWSLNSQRHQLPPEQFKKIFIELKLPSIYKKIAVTYKTTLKYFYQNHKLHGTMTRTDWYEIIHHDILNVEEHEAKESLLPLIPSFK